MSAPVLGGRCQSGRSSLGRSIAMCGRTRAAMWRFERTAGWTARGRAPIGLALEHFDRFRQYLRRGAPGAHAYVILIGLETFDPLDLLRAVKKGLPYRTFERFRRNTSLSFERVTGLIDIPRRTLTRRKREGRFLSSL